MVIEPAPRGVDRGSTAAVAEAGRVRRFQCLAPTEWNFHPGGPLARMLRGATIAPDRGGRDAIERLMAAFDPCVGYRLTVREPADA